MASNTETLDLLKMDPVADADSTFNVETMLNENWEKIDTAIKTLNENRELLVALLDGKADLVGGALKTSQLPGHAGSHGADGSDPITLDSLGAAAKEHGNHVPATQTASNRKFLRNDNTWQEVTPAGIGLGNVPNVATNDQTPTYTAASAPAALVSGEKLSIAFGKIAKAIADFISHLANKNNPHGVTLGQLAAAAASHKHSADDVNSGSFDSARLPIVPVVKGGTGVTTLVDLLHAMFQKSKTTATYIPAFDSGWSEAGYLNLRTLRNSMGLGDTTGAVPEVNGGTGVTSIDTLISNYKLGKVASGSYVGTGGNYLNSKVSLSLGFRPKFVMVSKSIHSYATYDVNNFILLVDGMNKVFVGNSSTDYVLITFSNNGVAWNYNPDASINATSDVGTGMLNGSGTTYYYVAIG